MIVALFLLCPATQLQADKPAPQPKRIGLQFVEPAKAPQPPDYGAIKAASDAKLAQEAVEAQLAAQAAYVAPAAPTQFSGGSAKLAIYNSESGNDPTRWNGSGCLGLGQACPASKLLVICPTMDYSCEDTWFTNYMLARYGSWDAAWAWWQRTDCRPYCGHWW